MNEGMTKKNYQYDKSIMGITKWFVNNLDTEERNLTRDLISVAVADGEFVGEEHEIILEICMEEGMSFTEVMDAIRDTDKTARQNPPHTIEEKKDYILHLIEVMSSDDDYPALEIHVIEFIAKKIGISPMQILSFVMDEIEEGNIEKGDGFDIVNNFVHYFAKTGR